MDTPTPMTYGTKTQSEIAREEGRKAKDGLAALTAAHEAAKARHKAALDALTSQDAPDPAVEAAKDAVARCEDALAHARAALKAAVGAAPVRQERRKLQGEYNDALAECTEAKKRLKAGKELALEISRQSRIVCGTGVQIPEGITRWNFN